MCGIVASASYGNVEKNLILALHRLEYRGYDSAGLSILHDGALKTVKTAGKVAALEEKVAALGDNALTGSLGIAHTRWATHGVPSEVNAHPHVAGTIALVHNGIVENYRALKEKLTAEGYSFESETDTEVLVKLIHSKRKQSADLKEAVRAALLEAHGSFAIAVLDSEEPDVLICAREKSPLVVGLGIGENFIASDVLALLPVTSRFIYLDDGEMATVYRERVEIFKVSGIDIKRIAFPPYTACLSHITVRYPISPSFEAYEAVKGDGPLGTEVSVYILRADQFMELMATLGHMYLTDRPVPCLHGSFIP